MKARSSASAAANGAGSAAEARKTSKPVRPAKVKAKAKAKARKPVRKDGALRRTSGAGHVKALGAIGDRLSADGAPGDGRPRARKSRDTDSSAAAALAAIDAALAKQALLPVLIDVSQLASYTEYIGIVSGRSDRQVDAIAEGILSVMKARGRSLLGQEGSGSGRWTLLDFGDVVIHVFYHPVREFYDLESLWVDAPRVPLKVPPEAEMAQPDSLYGHL